MVIYVVYADTVEIIQADDNDGSEMKDCKEDNNGGTVYVRWGNDECPSTAQLVYSGRVGEPDYRNSGGGSNPQCLPLDPNFLTVTVMFMDIITLMYHVEFVMSVIVLQRT